MLSQPAYLLPLGHIWFTLHASVLPMSCSQVITEERSLAVAEYAFEFAYLNNRQRVTAVHKANIMKKGDGMFLKVSE